MLHRVAEIADRPPGYRPPGAAGFTNLIQLPYIVGEILATGPKSKKVTGEVGRLVAALGPELSILRDVPLDDVRRVGGSLLGEGITRLRRGEVIRDAGYDGEYGTIRLFQPDELHEVALFSLAGAENKTAERARGSRPAARPAPDRGDALPAVPAPAPTGTLLDGLDPDQRAAAAADGPLLIIAGPGSGKTRTLTYRIAHQIADRGQPAESFLAITFTRRAALQMQDRLAALCSGGQPTVTTFHGLGLRILREQHQAAGLSPRFKVADEATALQVATEVAGSERDGRKLLGSAELRRALADRDLVDFDGLVELAAAVLRDDPAAAAGLRARWPRISVDEYQDIDPAQYELLRLISGDGAGLTAIGDPDQAIYGFRGADVGIFGRFAADFPGASTVELARNYRSNPAIVTAAMQAIAPATLIPGRTAIAAREGTLMPTGVVTLDEAADEHAEAAWIAATVDKLLGGASFHSLDSGRADGHEHGKLGLADIAVLYRTDAQAAPLAQALTRAGLPYQKRSHDRLARRPGVADVVRELRLAEGGDVAGRVTAAVRGIAAARGARDATVTDVRAAGELLLPLARRCGEDLERFLTEIATGAETDALDPRAEAITLLTLHGAKGLEFDVVFLAGCERGLLPLRLPGPESRAAHPGGRGGRTAAAVRRDDPGPGAAAAQLRRPADQARQPRIRPAAPRSWPRSPPPRPGSPRPGVRAVPRTASCGCSSHSWRAPLPVRAQFEHVFSPGARRSVRRPARPPPPGRRRPAPTARAPGRAAPARPAGPGPAPGTSGCRTPPWSAAAARTSPGRTG